MPDAAGTQTGGPFSDRKQRQTPLSGCEGLFQVKDAQSEMVAHSLKEIDFFLSSSAEFTGRSESTMSKSWWSRQAGKKPASPESVQKKKMKPVEGLCFKVKSFIVNGVPTQLLSWPRPFLSYPVTYEIKLMAKIKHFVKKKNTENDSKHSNFK